MGTMRSNNDGRVITAFTLKRSFALKRVLRVLSIRFSVLSTLTLTLKGGESSESSSESWDSQYSHMPLLRVLRVSSKTQPENKAIAISDQDVRVNRKWAKCGRRACPLAKISCVWEVCGVLPRNTQKARSFHLRLKVVELSSAGHSGIEIAEQLGISPKTVQRCLKRFIEVDSRYPCGLDAGQVESMRVEELNTLEHYQRQIALRLSRMSEPTTFAQETKAVEVAAMAGSAYVKLSEQKARLFGLNSVKPEVSNVTNNLLITGTTEVDYLKNLARLKELEHGH
jgi:hypothetical protein